MQQFSSVAVESVHRRNAQQSVALAVCVLSMVLSAATSLAVAHPQPGSVAADGEPASGLSRDIGHATPTLSPQLSTDYL